jgi:hypothetical protein
MPALAPIFWRGFVHTATINVGTSPTECASEIHFNQIHKSFCKRINYQKLMRVIGPLQTSIIVKGVSGDPGATRNSRKDWLGAADRVETGASGRQLKWLFTRHHLLRRRAGERVIGRVWREVRSGEQDEGS